MELPKAFFKLFDNLPRQGPGSVEVTLEALSKLPPLPESPRVLDIGCGTGGQTLVLAEKLGVPVTAIDLYEPNLRKLDSAARDRGLGDLITTRHVDMNDLGYAPDSVDLIWSEGAIYNIGFGDGLRKWRPMLKPGGLVAASELTWLTDDPPKEVNDYLRAAYPGIGTVDSNIEAAVAAGFEVLDHFALPREAWWDDYYTPLLERIERFKPGADNEMKQVIAETEKEIDMHRRFSDFYGYVFFLMKRVD